MRAGIAALLLCTCAAAQDHPVVRGVLLHRDLGVSSGVLTLRDGHDFVLRYRYDSHTYIERDNRSVEAAALRPGDPVEVVSEEVPGGEMRAARSVHVLFGPPVDRHPRTKQPEAAPAGLEFSGLILRINSSSLVLHTRTGDQEILLGPATHCFYNGGAVSQSSLVPNMHVFVRANSHVSGKPEAIQVVWGSMLEPK